MGKSLIPNFSAGGESRLDLFRTWLEKGQDFQKVEVEIARRNTQKQKAKTKEKCMSKRELEQDPRYTPDDVKDLIQRKTALGQYIDDPNFPGREDLRQYIVSSEVSKEAQHIREDEQQILSATRVSGAEALALTEEGADFSAASTPSIHDVLGFAAPPTVSDEVKGGGKGKDGKGKRRGGKGKTKEGKDGDAENQENEKLPDKPPTPLEKAVLLKKSVFLVRDQSYWVSMFFLLTNPTNPPLYKEMLFVETNLEFILTITPIYPCPD